jgi:hypothetical protein
MVYGGVMIISHCYDDGLTILLQLALALQQYS